MHMLAKQKESASRTLFAGEYFALEGPDCRIVGISRGSVISRRYAGAVAVGGMHRNAYVGSSDRVVSRVAECAPSGTIQNGFRLDDRAHESLGLLYSRMRDDWRKSNREHRSRDFQRSARPGMSGQPSGVSAFATAGRKLCTGSSRTSPCWAKSSAAACPSRPTADAAT